MALSLAACDTADDAYWDEIDDVELRSDDDGTIIPPGYIQNGLEEPNVTGINAAYGLSTNEGMAPTSDLRTDANKNKTAQYLVECALPAGSSVTKDLDDGLPPLTFYGHLGLAPEWENGVCDGDCQEWVSACLLARTNVSGQTVMIYMRGHTQLGYDVPQGAVLEAGFWGNLFDNSDDRFLCKGSGLSVVESIRSGRTCLTGGWCGFTAYADCTTHDRCAMAGPGGDIPSDCQSGSLAEGPAQNTISTFLVVE